MPMKGNMFTEAAVIEQLIAKTRRGSENLSKIVRV